MVSRGRFPDILGVDLGYQHKSNRRVHACVNVIYNGVNKISFD